MRLILSKFRLLAPLVGVSLCVTGLLRSLAGTDKRGTSALPQLCIEAHCVGANGRQATIDVTCSAKTLCEFTPTNIVLLIKDHRFLHSPKTNIVNCCGFLRSVPAIIGGTKGPGYVLRLLPDESLSWQQVVDLSEYSKDAIVYMRVAWVERTGNGEMTVTRESGYDDRTGRFYISTSLEGNHPLIRIISASDFLYLLYLTNAWVECRNTYDLESE